MRQIVLIAAPGVKLPARPAILADVLAQALRRCGADVDVTPIAAGDAIALERADRAVVIGECAQSLDLAGDARRVVPAALCGPRRRPAPLPVRGVRLHIDDEPWLAPDTEAAPRFERLKPATQESFARLARAVLGRRVGVALGAGGAWGYAHVRLLQDLLDHGVPIDAVAGSSFGAVVGAYFCARGRDGLAQMIAEREAIGRAARRAIVSMDPLEAYLDRSLGGVRLEDLAVPLLPVAFNIDGGRFHVAREGKVSRAVRLSGSLPGLFAPTVIDAGRIVDGCVHSLVPDGMFGDDFALVIASNVVPPPQPRAPRTIAAGRLGAWLHAVDPVARVKDLIRSAQYWIHAAGETGPAHVRFRLAHADALPWDFGQVGAVMRRSQDDTRRCAAQARQKWEALRCE